MSALPRQLQFGHVTRRRCAASGSSSMTKGLPILLYSSAVACLVVFGCREPAPVTSTSLSVDLGVLDSTADPTHTFLVRNTSADTFAVTSFQRDCGCHDTDLRVGQMVPPGEVLAVQFSLSKYRGGSQTGRMIVSTDSTCPDYKDIVLSLKATLPRPLWTEPTALSFVAGESGQSQQLTIRSELPGLLDTFHGVATSRGLVDVRLVERTSETLHFKIRTHATTPAEGEAFEFVAFEFDDQRYPLHTLQVLVHGSERNRSVSLSSLQ